MDCLSFSVMQCGAQVMKQMPNCIQCNRSSSLFGGQPENCTLHLGSLMFLVWQLNLLSDPDGFAEHASMGLYGNGLVKHH